MRYWTSAVQRTAALCIVAGTAFAQTPPASLPQGALEDVVVVANRTAEPLVRVGNSVTVITDDEIKASQAAVVSDLLVETPGLTVVRNGGVGQPTSVFIRGADSPQTVVLIDGVQLNDPSAPSGGFDFGNLLMDDIARIEILRGAQSTLYGSQAIGGVVSIITREPTGPLGGGLGAEGGARNTGYFTGSLGGKSDDLMWRVAGDYYTTDGISAFDKAFGGKELDGSKLGGFSGRLRYDFTPDVQLDLRGYYTHVRTDFDGFDTPTFSFGDDSEYGTITQYTEYAGLNFQGLGGQLANRIAFHSSDTDRKSFDPMAGPVTETFYGIGRNKRWEYQGTWKPASGFQAVFGLQRERTTLVTDTPAYDFTPMPLNSEATIDSAYLQVQDELVKGFTATAGVRYDKHDVFGSHMTGQGAIAWALNDSTTILRASVGEGFKAPALYQLFSPYGNLALQPEEATSWDAGIEQHMLGRQLMVSATYFSRRSRDLIEFFNCSTPGPLCTSEPFGYYANLARADARGIETQLRYTPIAHLTLAANYTYTDATDRSPDASTYGNELPRRPKSSGNASAAYRWPGNLTTTVVLRYAGQSFDDPANVIPLAGYTLVDFRVSYEINDRLEAYGRIENATNKQYETAYQYGSNGRGAFVGARLTF
jgi:vitamin B12 transporter